MSGQPLRPYAGAPGATPLGADRRQSPPVSPLDPPPAARSQAQARESQAPDHQSQRTQPEHPPQQPRPQPPEAQPPAQPAPQKKRRRPALACEQCRRRKIKCDRNSPCGHCTRARIASCTYVPTHVPASKTKAKSIRPLAASSRESAAAASASSAPPLPLQPQVQQLEPQAPAQPRPRKRQAVPPAESIVADGRGVLPGAARVAGRAARLPSKSASSVPSSKAGSASDTSNVDWLVARVHELEEKLASVVHITDEQETTRNERAEAPLTGTVSKTRYFGTSHWINVIDLVSPVRGNLRCAIVTANIANQLPTEFAILGRAEVDKTDVYHALVKCKTLARRIKELRYRPLSSENIGKHIPPRAVADQLVENYLRTCEGLLRIVHVPSFRADYERYWQNPDAANDAFVMQMQLCMALGSIMYDDVFSMRATAVQWIQEAQLWLMLPPEKSRMTIAAVQIGCLLILAKSICGVGPDLTWIASGSLVRKAMYMGLHRDPSRLGKMTTFRAEIRRRLWATILELNLQSAFESGGFPLLQRTDYDTRPPANIDDELLGDETDGEQPIGEPPEVPTQTSVHIAVLKSFPLRLDLLKKANDFGRGQSYDEVLRLNSELTKACRELSQRLLSLRSKVTGHGPAQINTFHVSMAELYLYRFFHALHQTVIAKSFDDHRYYFSRRMCLDSALKLMHIYGLSGPHPLHPADGFADFHRTITSGSGMFRYIPVQALFYISVELIHQKKGQSASLGYLPSLGDSDLRSCLEAAVSWTINRVRAGETNIKIHCFIAATLGHVDALTAGLDDKAIDDTIISRATDSALRCLEALKEVAKREGISSEEESNDIGEMSDVADVQLDWMEDWAWENVVELPWQQWSQGAFDGSAALPPDQFLSQ
ncbi:fungal specific transcription factor domain-containing protein [Purpureocillium lavendulum]|uniref:Fungal specific transcription factor domain-containing protein n=1 Tax=Purpureocillium lavendulum TaxID=1247861 RepID=A0AB34FVN6_9HYPO|nr:fungal specific transcription factor domain-containing protein [Purpureocillium lavendulum]